jgi:uncharacterized membrane protein (TIGR02234 family)
MTMRPFVVVLIVLLAAAALVIVAYGATWATATVPIFAGAANAGPGREVALSGRELAPLGAAMGWVGLAAVPGLLATRTWGRRVTGAVVVLAGGCAGVIGVAFALTDLAAGGGGSFVDAALGTSVPPTDVASSAWWVGAVGAGLAMMVCGISAVIFGPAWPRLGARYSRAAEPAGSPSAASAWDALDRGEDPTVQQGSAERGGAPGSMGSSGQQRPDRRTDGTPWEET